MMSSYLPLALAQEGLTFREVVDNLPTDPASIFVLLLLAGAVIWVILGSRKKGKPTG